MKQNAALTKEIKPIMTDKEPEDAEQQIADAGDFGFDILYQTPEEGREALKDLVLLAGVMKDLAAEKFWVETAQVLDTLRTFELIRRSTFYDNDAVQGEDELVYRFKKVYSAEASIDIPRLVRLGRRLFLSPDDLPELALKIMQSINEKEQVVAEEAKQIKQELHEVEKKIGNIIKAIEDGTIEYELLGGRLKTLKARREELECRLDTLRSPVEGLTEEMVMQFLLATKDTLVNRESLMECKKIMDLYVHQIKVFNDDSVDVMFKIPLGADKDGVGGGT